MTRFWPIPLWLELMAAVFVALLATNFATSLFFQMAWQGTIEPAFRAQFAARAAHAAAAVMDTEAPERRDRLLKAMSGPGQRVSVSAAPDVLDTDQLDPAMIALVKRVEPRMAALDVRVSQEHRRPQWRHDGRDPGAGRGTQRPPGAMRSIAMMTLSVRDSGGQWINAEFDLPLPFDPVYPLILSGVVLIAMLSAISFWMSRRIVRPLGALESAASALGPGDPPDPVPERGPRALKAAIRSFNAMSRRLLSTLDSQRTIMAAVAHDLRSPITSLRLRTEFVGDAETKERMLETLDEMQTMTEAVIDLARAGKSSEQSRLLDLSSLADSLVQDMADTGAPVSFAGGCDAPVMIRRTEITRAVRNLIENAVRYGGSAKVGVTVSNGQATVTVDDDGPGLPEDQLDALFMPFARLETSRNKETGGHGLGLTIARMIARGHGGDVTLANRAPTGLRAALRLPMAG